ncbi:MAG: prepilin-type N-terminal cleavage/methylation domain-containing protein [Lentimonas sp.]|jgi:prepilin-type N-terminal cleavage/methylation domain-containing protein
MHKIKQGFSLIELSVVMLIIAVLMLAVLKGSSLIDEARLSVARQQTANSPVWDIEGLVSWYETTMVGSFEQNELFDSGVISLWRDLGSSDANSGDAVATGSPIYDSESLNGLPTLEFNGGEYFSVSDGELINQLTIIIVFKFEARASCSGIEAIMMSEGPWVIGSVHFQSNCLDPSMFPRYEIHPTGGFNGNISMSDGKYHIISVVDDNSTTRQMYTDGANVSSAVTDVLNRGMRSYTIGAWDHGNGTVERHLSGNIAEIIIFNRDLNDQERGDVERYLSNKWGIELL